MSQDEFWNIIKPARLTDDEFEYEVKKLNNFEFKSDLNFLSMHRGFRRGEFHCFTGSKGAGKSTLCRTLLAEITKTGKSVFIYLSEEVRTKYMLDVNTMFRQMDLPHLTDNILVMSEFDLVNHTAKNFIRNIEEIIKKIGVDIFIFDNFTTSFLSELNLSDQSWVLRNMRRISEKCDIPFVIFFHTGKHGDTKKLDTDDIRGSSTAVNLASYAYAMHQHRNELGEIHNYLFVDKSRYHPRANKKYFKLTYNSQDKIFISDREIDKRDYKNAISDEKDYFKPY